MSCHKSPLAGWVWLSLNLVQIRLLPSSWCGGPDVRNDTHLLCGEIFKPVKENCEQHQHQNWQLVQVQSQVLLLSLFGKIGTGFRLIVRFHMLIAVTFLPLSGSANSELALNFEFKSKWEVMRGWDKDNVEVVIEKRELPEIDRGWRQRGADGSVIKG